MSKNPKNKANHRRWLKRLVLAAASAALLLVVGLGILIVPDQLRDVSEFSISFQLPEQEETDSPRSEETDNFTLSLKSNTTTSLLVKEIVPKDYRLIPDLSVVAEEHLDSVRELNRAADELLSALQTLFQTSKTMKYKEAAREVKGAWYVFHMVRYKQQHEHNFTAAQYNFSNRPLYRMRLAVDLKNAIDHEEWIIAGNTCAQLAMKDGKRIQGSWVYKDSPWYAGKAYYYRKAGLKGRLLIARDSIAPVLDKLTNSVYSAVEGPLVYTGIKDKVRDIYVGENK